MALTFKESLVGALARSGKTKVDLAKALGVSHGHIHHYLAGRNRPTISRLESIKEALGLDGAEYDELLNALIKEDPEFHSLARHLRLGSFTEFYVPFLREILKRSKIPAFQEKGVGVLDSDLWHGYIDVLPEGVRASEVFRFFLMKPTEKGIGVGWALVREKVPLEAKLYVPIAIGQNSIREFDARLGQEQPIRNSRALLGKQQKLKIIE